MKIKRFSIFSRISVLVFALITFLCLLFTGLTYYSTTSFHEASTQLLNKDVASHIATFTSPFEKDGINKKKADSVFYDAMVLSPSAEVYFLDSAGRVIAFHADEKEIKQWMIPLANIKRLIGAGGADYIKNTDPKHPEIPKIFSAAKVSFQSKNLGYIYVILGSNTHVTNMLYNSYFGSLLIKIFLVIILATIISTVIYLNRFTRSFDYMISILERYQNGDLEARFPVKKNDELEPITTAFNKMADLLSYNIDRLTKSEQERKDFIANISHDLRTPLSIARGYTETLLMKNDKKTGGAEQEEFLQLVHKKIRQVEYMLKQLFDLSKMESVEFAPNKEPFVFSEILLEIIQASTAMAAEKQITIDCKQCENPAWIFADVRMMERVVQNLVVNAINYTPENGVIIISLDKENLELIFKIENSGAPLYPELLRWFNTPYELNLANSRQAKSGIGLMIVKKILLLHQYSFKAEVHTAIENSFIIRMPVLQNEA